MASARPLPFARFPIGAALAGLLLSGCAHEPAFRTELPAELDDDGKTIAIIGDLQQTPGLVRFIRRREDNSQAQARLIDDLKARLSDLSALVVVGDLVFSARSSRDWAHLDRLVAPFAESMPVLPAIGNHDYPCFLIEICNKSTISDGILERFPWFVPGQPYAVAGDDLLLLFLDSETGLERQGVWLEERLASAVGQYTAALVFFHRPAFTNSIDRGAVPDVNVREHIVPRLERAGLPVVGFSGHIHGYEYIVRNGVSYVTTAGGGGPRGAMADERAFDRYRGPDCPQAGGTEIFRPFNYVLLRASSDQLTLDVRGFCRGDNVIDNLDTIKIPL